MTKTKRVLSSLLLAGLLLQTLVACGTKKDAATNTESSVESSTVAETTLSPEQAFPYPEADYKGYEFNLLVRGEEFGFWVSDEMQAEELNGEPINDAKYTRNKEVEDLYNIKLNVVQSSGNISDQAKKSVMAGDNSYDMFMMGAGELKGLATDGYLYDLNKMDALNLDMPWWDQKANEGLSVANKLFMTTGDISYFKNRATEVILFNKDMIPQYNLENPYDLVRSGKWTLDKMLEMCRGVSQDLDGNGKYDQADKYGIVIYTSLVLDGLLSGKERISTKDDQDIPYLTLSNDRSQSIIQDYFKFMYDDTLSFDWARYYDVSPTPYDIGLEIFQTDRALFDFNGMHAVPNLRQMETDFGIIPIPKYDEAQDTYYSHANYAAAPFTCVPVTAIDPERTGVIIDALARKSREHVKPAYYETSLKGKFARDDESSEMMDLVFDNMVYDLALYFDFGGVVSMLNNMVTNKKTDFTSQYAKIEKKVVAEMDKFANTIKDLKQ